MALEDLRSRRAELGRAQDRDQTESENLRGATEAAAEKVAELDEKISHLNAKLAAQDVERAALTRNVEEIESRIRRFGERAAENRRKARQPGA